MSIVGTYFDWSILDRQGLIEMLWQIHPEVVDKTLTPAQFKSIVAKHIKTWLPVKVSLKSDPIVDLGWIYTGGTYYSDWDADNRKCIEVVFVYNPFESHVNIDQKKFKKMCNTFSDVVLHELIHMRQYRRRDFKVLPDYESNAEMSELRQEQSYLGCTDEIDAYSFNIACELLDKLGNDRNAVIEYLGKTHKKRKLRSHSLRFYLKAFEYNHSHPIIKRLIKRIIRYLPNAELGKPFRTADWINH
jgi:hypothetical protein